MTGGPTDLSLDFGPDGATWETAAAPATPRYTGNRAALQLPDGGALVSGGNVFDEQTQAFVVEGSAERFDPTTQTWREVARDPLLGRDFFASAVVDETRALLVGGYDGSSLPNAVLLNFADGEVRELPLPEPLRSGVAVARNDGTILYVGGYGEGEIRDTALLFDGTTMLEMPPLPEPRGDAYIAALPDGRVSSSPGLVARLTCPRSRPRRLSSSAAKTERSSRSSTPPLMVRSPRPSGTRRRHRRTDRIAGLRRRCCRSPSGMIVDDNGDLYWREDTTSQCGCSSRERSRRRDSTSIAWVPATLARAPSSHSALDVDVS